MKDKKFMDQKVKDLSIKELAKSILVKLKDKPGKEPEEELSIEEEMKKYPERFETLSKDFNWIHLTYHKHYGLKVLNATWNYPVLNNKVFYVEIGKAYKEIVRRKGVFK